MKRPTQAAQRAAVIAKPQTPQMVCKTQSPSLFHILFVSTETEPLSTRQLRELVSALRERNENLGITGLLLHANGRFMQVLEGPETAVKEVFEIIRSDSRHKNIDVLRCEEKSHRYFQNWQVGLHNFAVDMETLPVVSSFLHPDFDTSLLPDDPYGVFRALLAFRTEHATESENKISHYQPRMDASKRR